MGKLIERPTRPPTAIPRLREGDRLTAKEFLRRYEADPHVARAELIRGVVYVNAVYGPDGSEEAMSPIASGGHATPQMDVTGALLVYRAATPGVTGGGPATIIVNDRTLPEPDCNLRITEECGGASRQNADDYIVGPPELLVEVANTSVSRDMGPKYDAYQEGGVAEYLVWRTADREFHLFTLRRGEYRPVLPVAGILRSVVFPGLWLDMDALRASDASRILTTLQLGLASPEHAAFVAKLAARAKRKRK